MARYIQSHSSIECGDKVADDIWYGLHGEGKRDDHIGLPTQVEEVIRSQLFPQTGVQKQSIENRS